MLKITSQARSRAWAKLAPPAALSTLVVFPFTILELVNRRPFREPLPIPLFTGMWLLAFAFFHILDRTLRADRRGAERIRVLSGYVAGVLLLVLIASLWIGIVVDQMPCFLGLPDCD